MNSAPSEAREIFTVAVEQYSPEQWPSYLDKACADNPELRRRVELLLEAHSGDESLLDSPAVVASPTLDHPISEQPGDTIGPYKLLQQIGEGGMGVVYMAEQTEPVERRVALKVIKPGMDTRKVIARFEAERQALAMMDHPNIAKVLDAGTTDSGRPYFVMELVKGVPVTQYCDKKQLTPRERLELFVPICHAVQHAHHKGIIHRDIKPSNVLVARYDDRPVPKIIDFGVAKATEQRLTEKTIFTEFGQVVGTVEYMSPEQAEFNQLDIDTRTDVYSLGVLLYELLTGETPFDRERLRSAAFDELLRIIREEEPPRPSLKLSTSASLPSIAANRHVEPKKLSALVHGELDWIVMKALEKDRTRRYDTASKFAEDVQHYLNDEAVEACPPSAAYRFRKVIRRNKAVFGTLAVVLATAVTGAAVSLRYAAIAHRSSEQAIAARTEAEQEADRSSRNFITAQNAVNLMLAGVAESSLARAPEFEPLRTELLQSALDFYEQLLVSSPEDSTLYVRTALIKARLFRYEDSVADFQKSLDLAPDNDLAHAQYASFLTTCQNVAFRDNKAAEIHAKRAVELNPHNGGHWVILAAAYRHLSENAAPASTKQDRIAAGLQAVNTAIRISSEQEKPTSQISDEVAAHSYRLPRSLHQAVRRDVRRSVLPEAYVERSEIYGRKGDIHNAISDIDRAIQLDPYFADAYRLRGRYYRILKDYEQALDNFRKAEELDPYNLYIFEERGQLLASLRRFQEAVEDFNRAIALAPQRFYPYRDRVSSLIHLGQYDLALTDLWKIQELSPGDLHSLELLPLGLVAQSSEASFKHGLRAVVDQAVETSTNSTRARRIRTNICLALGDLEQARSDLEALLTPDNRNYYDHYTHAMLCLKSQDSEGYRVACERMVEAFQDTDNPLAACFSAWSCVLIPSAVVDYSPVVALAKAAVAKAPNNDQYLGTLGAVLYRAGQIEAALQQLTKVADHLEQVDNKSESSPAYTWYFLAMAHQKLGHTDGAYQWLEKANEWTDGLLSNKDSPASWNRRLTLKLLRDEAEELLGTGLEKGGLEGVSEQAEDQPE